MKREEERERGKVDTTSEHETWYVWGTRRGRGQNYCLASDAARSARRVVCGGFAARGNIDRWLRQRET